MTLVASLMPRQVFLYHSKN